MSDVIKTINLKDGNVLEIYQDSDPNDPRKEWDNLGIMICFTKNYNLGDHTDLKSEQFNSWDELKDHLIRNERPLVILPLYMYSHSGITINTTGFSCQWDSGQIGFIYVNAKKIDEMGCTLNDGEEWTDYIQRLENSLISEVKTYDEYVSGEVYGFVIKDADDEEIDSCWGFYGDNHKTNGILDHIGKDNINLDDL